MPFGRQQLGNQSKSGLQARARKQFRAAAHEWEAELALLQADLADIAIQYRQHLDVELAVIERTANPDALLH